MDKKKFPLTLLRDIENLLKELKIIGSKNSDLIELVDPGNDLIEFIDKDQNSTFHFTVSNPNQSHQFESLFHLEYYPTDRKSLN